MDHLHQIVSGIYEVRWHFRSQNGKYQKNEKREQANTEQGPVSDRGTDLIGVVHRVQKGAENENITRASDSKQVTEGQLFERHCENGHSELKVEFVRQQERHRQSRDDEERIEHVIDASDDFNAASPKIN